jgi:5-formyltetrahydrofolate cyclo-ligase
MSLRRRPVQGHLALARRARRAGPTVSVEGPTDMEDEIAQDQITAEKARLRELLKARRDEVPEAAARAAAVAAQADDVLALAPARRGEASGPVVSFYMPIGSELDPRPLFQALAARGATGALPVIEKRGKPLLFRAYREGDALEEKRWGIREPLASQPLREPDILLMPMLAFDDAGWRLGYGGGFYDRTLQVLRAKKTVVAIGLAYDEQRLENVVHADYDERLDCVLTPSGLKRFQRQGKAKA